MKNKNNHKIHKDKNGEFIYKTYFIRGKMKRQKIYVIDGMLADEFYIKNADPITLFQNGDYELLPEQEI